MLDDRERELLQLLWTQGRLSRWELHEQTGLTPNRVGTLIDNMLSSGLLREGAPQSAKAGRPRVPLEIDPSQRHCLGLVIAPGRVEMGRLGLGGQLIEQFAARDVADPNHLITVAAAQLGKAIDARTLSVGVSVTGFLDPGERTILLSSALPGKSAVSLSPIYRAAGDVPVVLGNDMQALAARWLLLHRAQRDQDVLLVWFTDGRLGSAMLINGRPNRGCATGGNELGHTRYFVDTEKCFCGQVGCLERIVSTDFLRRQDPPSRSRKVPRSLAERVESFDGGDAGVARMIDYLSVALSNSVNFVRPHRLVLVSPLMRHTAFAAALTTATRDRILPEMAARVRIDRWDQAAAAPAESAAWLAIAELLHNGWNAATPTI